MKQLPPIGAKVRFKGNGEHHNSPCTGTVVAHYPGERAFDEEEGDWYTIPDHVGMQVDSLPEWWNYTGTDRFAPEVSDIELI